MTKAAAGTKGNEYTRNAMHVNETQYLSVNDLGTKSAQDMLHTVHVSSSSNCNDFLKGHS